MRDQTAILALEEEYRVAKLQRDVAALDRLLDPAVVATNQNGNTRNKSELLELWTTFRISLLTLDSPVVQISDDLATVTGRQTEINSTGTDRMLFTRVWRRAGESWRLVAVSQFRDPNENAVRSRTYTAITTPAPRRVRVAYELFRDGRLVGVDSLVVTTGRTAAIQIPGEPNVSISAAWLQPERATLNVTPNVPGTSRMALGVIGNAPAEVSWQSRGYTYRLRVRGVFGDDSTDPFGTTIYRE
jgi:hypothetical protein